MRFTTLEPFLDLKRCCLFTRGSPKISNVDVDVEILTMGNFYVFLIRFVLKCIKFSSFTLAYIELMYVSIHVEYFLVGLNTHDSFPKRTKYGTKLGTYPSHYQPMNSVLNPFREKQTMRFTAFVFCPGSSQPRPSSAVF